ncbi:MAG: SusC/RagA family TonB-linked outer membrane protein [Gemmatimonadota bacterium]|jgi:TonB-linked SusC/RagA family outer membrane protein|nr:SusC/RagA family TonB-linked outer membrane protein [Gemmatimonadota bacterium]
MTERHLHHRKSSYRERAGLFFAAFVALAMLPATGFAQAGSISGSVVDSGSGQPIPAAQLSLQGSSRSTFTNESGSFTLTDLPADSYTIIARHAGYQELTLADVIVGASGTASVTLRMGPAALALQAIVSTGLVDPVEGALSPITVARLSSEEMPVVVAGSPLQNLQGRIPGVQMTRQSGEPGSGVTVMLRTPATNRESQPLLVVDGVIVSDIDAAQNIPQESIESIEILRGAAAASIYGSRGGAGVISITTKRGLSLPQGTTRFLLRSEIGLADAFSQNDLASHHAYLLTADGSSWADATGAPIPRSQRVLENSGNPFQQFMDNEYPTPIYNNLEAISQRGMFQTHNFSVSQNRLNTNFAFSISRQREEGTIKGNDGYRQTTARFNLDHRFLETMSLGISMSHTGSERQELTPADFFGAVLLTSRDADIAESDPNSPFTYVRYPQGSLPENPLWIQETHRRQSDATRNLLSASYSWSPIPWLTASGVLGFDRSEAFTWAFSPTALFGPGDAFGDLSLTETSANGYNAEAQLSFRRDFGPLHTRATFRALTERLLNRNGTRNSSSSMVDGVVKLQLPVNPFFTSQVREEETRLLGYLFDLGLDYQGRFALNVLGRRDASSRFGANERWQSYYRTAGVWRMSAEEWFNLPHVSEFNLSLARGTAGSVPGYLQQYETVFLDNASGGLRGGQYGNPNLRPSRTTENEASVNAILFERFGLTLTHAWQRTTGQIAPSPLPNFLDFSYVYINAGSVAGHSTEFSLEADIIRSPNIGWRSTIIADRSRSKIDEWTTPCLNPAYLYDCAGVPVYSVYGFRNLKSVDELTTHHGGSVVAENRTNEFQVNDEGLLVWAGTEHNWDEGMVNGEIVPGTWGSSTVIAGAVYDWGIPIKETDENGAAVRQLIGQSFATNIGWTNSLRYGGFNFSAQLHSAFGFAANNVAARSMITATAASQNYGKMDQFGKPDGLKKPIGYYTAAVGLGSSDYLVERADYIKLRTASVSYTLSPSQFGRLGLGRLGAEQLQVGVTARNLFTITDYSGYDPEQAINLGTRTNASGINDYPSSRIWTMNATLIF